jgi:hypothetical protein
VNGPVLPDELPELGPWLGRLPEIARRDPTPDLALDPIRLDLVSALFERAAAARGFLLASDRESARAALDRAEWLAVWRKAVERSAAATIAAIDARLRRAADRSGALASHLAAARPDDEYEATLRARLEAAGIPLERLLARPLSARDDWGDAVQRACRALEASWDELEAVARAELTAWEPAVAALDAWRPPRALWLGALTLAAVTAGWVGLALGGYLSRPAWLDPFADWFWGLPWP